MESQTQTTTAPPVTRAAGPVDGIRPNNDVANGHRLAEGELPNPKPAPKVVEKPEEEQSLDNRMATDEERNENEKQWEAYNESEWARYENFKQEIESVNPLGFLRAGETEEGERVVRHILANQSFQNGHEVNALLLEQLSVVFETDADRTKRVEAYNCGYSPDSFVKQATDRDRPEECGLQAWRPREWESKG